MFVRRIVTALIAGASVLLSGASTLGQVYSNGFFLDVPAFNAPNQMGPASSYPSQIQVTGGPRSISRIKVTLVGVSHTFAGDVVVLLVAPNGARVTLMNIESSNPIVDANIGFASDAVALLPDPPVTGVFVPTGGTFEPPSSGSGGGAANFNQVLGSDANGTWRLYVYDRAGGDRGQFSGGWTLELSEESVIGDGFVYQGRIGGIEPGSQVRIRLSPWDSLASTAMANRLASPVEVTTTVTEDGIVTVPVQLGIELPTDRDAFLQVEIASPPGAGFTTLSPRQRISPAPIANNSVRLGGATLASFARVDQASTYTANQTIATGNILAFGAIGNRAGSAENSDFIAFSRVNALNNITDLRLVLGDDPTGAADSFSIGTSSNGINFDARFIFKTDGSAFKPGGGSWSALSDRRLKHDIKPLEGSLDRLLGLRGVTFAYNDPARAGACEGTMMGFIAQDVEPIFPRWVSTDAEGYKAITITGFEALTVEALRELRAEKDAQIAEKDAEIADLREQIVDLSQRLERLESQGK